MCKKSAKFATNLLTPYPTHIPITPTYKHKPL